MNIFERATREAFRFPSSKGELTTEQLWDLPLQSKSDFNLDTVAKMVNADLRAMTEESFVAKVNPASDRQAVKLDVVKHIIAVKLAEADERAKAADRAANRQRLLGILEKKQGAELEALSAEELQRRLDALG